MISRDEIKLKERYILEEISKITDKRELEKLKYSLRTYLVIDSLQSKDYQLSTLIDDLLNKHNKLIKECNNLNQKLTTLNDFAKPIISDYYLCFLLNLVQNLKSIKTIYSNDIKELSYYKFSEHKAVSTSYQFYSSLEDDEIVGTASVILSNHSHYEFKSKLGNFKGIAGFMVGDYYFNKPYIYCTTNNNLFTYQVFNHEIMHGIDFYMNPKFKNSIFGGFTEIPTYTIDYLFLDFLEENNYNRNDIDALRRKKYDYIQKIANDTILEINYLLKLKYGSDNISTISCQNICSVISNKIYNTLFELASCVIAEGLYRQILVDRKQGLKNLKTIMKNDFFNKEFPDFSLANLDSYKLLQISSNMIGNKIKELK